MPAELPVSTPGVTCHFGRVPTATIQSVVDAVAAHQCALVGAPIDFTDAIEPACADLIEHVGARRRIADARIAVTGRMLAIHIGLADPDQHLTPPPADGLSAAFFQYIATGPGVAAAWVPVDQVWPVKPPDLVHHPVTENWRSSAQHEAAGDVSIELAPTMESAAVARSCLRSLIDFVDDDHQSGFSIALTEIIVNAIEATLRRGLDSAITVSIDLGGPAVAVTDHAGGFETSTPLPSDRGRGLTIARVFVPGLHVDTTGTGTTVHLPIGGNDA